MRENAYPHRRNVASKEQSLQDVAPGLKAVATRIENAKHDFLHTAMVRGCLTPEEARRVFRVYHEAKVIRFDAANSRYVVKDGAFWDSDTLNRAAGVIP